MRQAMAHDRGDAGKAEDDLVNALRRGIVRESGADVLVEGGAYLRQCGGKQARDIIGGSTVRIGWVECVLLLKRQRQFDLTLERWQRLCKRPSHKRVGVPRVQSRRAEVAGVERRNKAPNNLANRLTRRQARRCAAIAAQLGGCAQLAELCHDISVLGVSAGLLSMRSALVRAPVENRLLVHCLLIDVEEEPSHAQCERSSNGGKEAHGPSDFVVGPAD
jgi:hypothetical protein